MLFQYFCGVRGIVGLMQYFSLTAGHTEHPYATSVDLPDSLPDLHNPSVFVVSLFITVFIIGVIGNILVLWVTFRSLYGQMMSRFIFNIALADLLFLLTLPFLAYDVMAGWIFGSFMCRVIRALCMLGLYGSIFFMVLIAVHRYITVFHPLKRWTKTIQMIGFVWILSVLASLPSVVFSPEIQGDYRVLLMNIFPGPAWTSFSILNMNLLSFIIPLIIVVFCYSRLSCELSSLQHTSGSPDPDLNRQVQIRTRTLLAVVFVYFLFWGPINIVLFLWVLNIQGYMNTVDRYGLMQALVLAHVIAFSHCCLNPIIYLLSEQAFRREVIKFFRVFFGRFNLCATPSAPAVVTDE